MNAVGCGFEPRTHVRAIRIAVADTRHLIAEALAAVLTEDDSFEVVRIAFGRIAPGEIAEALPDIVLVGVGADTSQALALIDAVVALAPSVQIVIVADTPSRDLLAAVLERSLGGLLLTDHPAEDLVASLLHIAQGRAALPGGWQSALALGRSGPLDSLSDRQLEVLALLAEGCSYEEIGSRLFISINTVKFHTRSIFERLGVRNRMAAARMLADAPVA